MSLDFLTAEWLSHLKKQHQRWQEYDFRPLPEPEWPQRSRYALEWRPAPAHVLTPRERLPIADARVELQQELQRYIQRGKRNLPILLVRAQPGIGKTYAGIEAAQAAALEGKRVLYLMPTHAHWQTLNGFPHFRPELWYPWQPVNEETCMRNHAARVWMDKGYPLKALCNSLCPLYQAQCPFRAQAHQPQPIIAGVHEHLIYNIPLSFDLVIVDELPIRAFLQERLIPFTAVAQAVGHNATPFEHLCYQLMDAITDGQTLEGRRLLDRVGPTLTDFFALLDTEWINGMVPQIPHVRNEEEVAQAPHWFIRDLYEMLTPEHAAWLNPDIDRWLSRVIVSPQGLTLLKRARLDKHLPRRMIILDATANPELYRILFPNREIATYQPHVQMQGRILQVTERYYGKTSLDAALPDLLTAIEQLIKQHGYTQPGFITFKQHTDLLMQRFQTQDVAHFYGQRGSNALEHVDALFVIGSPSPSDYALQRQVAILQQDRLDPFVAIEVEPNRWQPVRSERLRPYQHSKDGQQPWRMISGFWSDLDLQTLSDTYRELELVQALHRARPLVRPCDVWLFSSVPLPHDIDAVWEQPPIAPSPDIHWMTWLRVLEALQQADENELVSYARLAELTGLSTHWLKRLKMLDAIAQLDGWDYAAVARTTRGRPPKLLSRCLPNVDVKSGQA